MLAHICTYKTWNKNTRGVFNTVWSAFNTSLFEWYNYFHVRVSSNTSCVQWLTEGCIHLRNRRDTHQLQYTTNLHFSLVNNSARMTSCGIIDTKSLPKIDYHKNLTCKHKNKLIAHVTLPFYLSHLVEDTKPNIQTDYTDHLVDISRLCTTIQVFLTPTGAYKGCCHELHSFQHPTHSGDWDSGITPCNLTKFSCPPSMLITLHWLFTQ